MSAVLFLIQGLEVDTYIRGMMVFLIGWKIFRVFFG